MHTLASGENLVLGSLVTDETVAKRRKLRLRQEAALWRLTDKGGLNLDEVIDLIEASRKAGPFKGRTMRQEAIDRYTAVYGS